jgi:hypothetical protein
MYKTTTIFLIYYVNICKHEHEKNRQSYGVQDRVRLVLNRLNETKGLIFIYTLLGT